MEDDLPSLNSFKLTLMIIINDDFKDIKIGSTPTIDFQVQMNETIERTKYEYKNFILKDID